MAGEAESDQVLFGIIPGVAIKLLVVNLEVGHRATRLTPPTIAPQNVLSQTLVGNRIDPQAREFSANRCHEANPLRLSTDARLCSSGRNLKNLGIEKSSGSCFPSCSRV